MRSTCTSPKPAASIVFRQQIAGAELKEHRTHFRRDPSIDNRENLGPSAAIPRAPHGHDRASPRPDHTVHFRQRFERVGDLHQPERTECSVERLGWHLQLFGVHSLEGGVTDAERSNFVGGSIHHLL